MQAAPATTRQFAARRPWACASIVVEHSTATLAYHDLVARRFGPQRPGCPRPAWLPLTLAGLVALDVTQAGCQGEPLAEADKDTAPQRDIADSKLPTVPLGLGLSFEQLAEPPDPARARLGRMLFFDPRLSADNDIACASCHEAKLGFAQTQRFPTGHRGQVATRRAMPLVNLAFSPSPLFFWDGRAHRLETQVLGPLYDPKEMAADPSALPKELKASGYTEHFALAFGSPKIDDARIALALADYLRTRLSGDSAWDRWKAGDENAVSEAVKRGDALFFGKADCFKCHFGPTFSDGRFHNLGIGWQEQTQELSDPGRGAVTGKAQELGAFKTPTLRDVARRPPYMHDGSLTGLRQVVEHYVLGGNDNPQLSPLIQPLELDDSDIDDLVAMLEALNGRGFADQAPRLPTGAQVEESPARALGLRSRE